MELKSFSKINLSLNVVKKYKKDKLHDIQSYFCLIDLFDKIKIKKIKASKDTIKFKGKFAKFVKIKDNSILEVLKILREKKIIYSYYYVSVNKRIPVFAGLGGGTSNAYSLIKYFVRNRIDKNLMGIFKKKVGTDLQLFFYKQGFLKNLNQVINFPRKHRLYFLIVYPNIKCSTKYIYSKIKKYSPKLLYNFKKISDKSKFLNFLTSKNNDLQLIVENKYPTIKKLIKEIAEKKGCYFSRMTGSGSVCYGVFKSKKAAKDALIRIRLKYPKYWALIAKTI